MDRTQRREELKFAENGYSSFFASCKIISYTTNDGDNDSSPQDYYSKTLIRSKKQTIECLEIVTEDSKEIVCSVDLGGWFFIDHEGNCISNERWETFEALMMNNSPDFQDQFGTRLANKLKQLEIDK